VRRWMAAAVGVGLLVIVAAAALVWLRAGAEITAPDPNNARVVARGKVVYAEYCASCHGAKLEGQPNWQHRLPNGRWPAPPHDPTGHTWHHPDKVLFQVTKFGMASLVPGRESDMPAFEGILSDTDIWAVLSYIESTWPADIRARQQRMNGGRP
jgi:mono/diheme cytochrome c family protein